MIIEKCLAAGTVTNGTSMSSPPDPTGPAAVGIGTMTSLNYTDWLAALVNFGVTGIGPVVAFVMFGYAAFLYFTSGGDESKVKSAREIMIGVVTGFTLLIMMKVIINFLTA